MEGVWKAVLQKVCSCSYFSKFQRRFPSYILRFFSLRFVTFGNLCMFSHNFQQYKQIIINRVLGFPQTQQGRKRCSEEDPGKEAGQRTINHHSWKRKTQTSEEQACQSSGGLQQESHRLIISLRVSPASFTRMAFLRKHIFLHQAFH